MISQEEQELIDNIKKLNEHINKKFNKLEKKLDYQLNGNKMKQVFKKISFQVGDLIVDTKEIKSGLVVGILIKHIKVLWEGKEVKISKWLLNNKVFKQEYKHLPRTKNTKKK